ncbi:MAG: hypothetical protein ACREH4_14780 [Vitreimonas sp.]
MACHAYTLHLAGEPGGNARRHAVYRCNGTVRNMDASYAAFDAQPGEALYLAPADRVTIW